MNGALPMQAAVSARRIPASSSLDGTKGPGFSEIGGQGTLLGCTDGPLGCCYHDMLSICARASARPAGVTRTPPAQVFTGGYGRGRRSTAIRSAGATVGRSMDAASAGSRNQGDRCCEEGSAGSAHRHRSGDTRRQGREPERLSGRPPHRPCGQPCPARNTHPVHVRHLGNRLAAACSHWGSQAASSSGRRLWKRSGSAPKPPY